MSDNTIQEVDISPKDEHEETSKTLIWFTYILYLLSLSLVGLFICYYKRFNKDNAFTDSHFHGLRILFWKTLLYTILIIAAGIVLAPFTMGISGLAMYVGLLGLCLWYLYKLIDGMIKLANDKPIAKYADR